ncbi:MAG: hypothetical protein JW712_00870 [Dehalococcoidales bacterium]|nr:hypothetical protein [Dehalococcoidales bacterium]
MMTRKLLGVFVAISLVLSLLIPGIPAAAEGETEIISVTEDFPDGTVCYLESSGSSVEYGFGDYVEYGAVDFDTGWQVVNEPSHILADVDFVDASNGWAVGSGGTIIHTSDGGMNSEYQASNTGMSLWGVSAVDASRCWAVGNSGTILHTADGGSTWAVQNSGVWYDLFDVHFIDTSNGWACGSGGTVLYTGDGGSTWTEQETNTNQLLMGLTFTDANNGWLVDTGGVIRHTGDSGSTWAVQSENASHRFQDVFFLDASTGWAVGYNTVLKTTDGGITWNSLTTDVSPRGVYFMDINTGWGVTYSGRILQTVDGGLTWTTTVTSPDYMLLGVDFVDSQTGWVVGEGMDIKKTTDGGSTWTGLSANPGPSWMTGDIDFITPDEGWLAVRGRCSGPISVGGISSVFHTEDGGLTWTEQNTGIYYFGVSLDFTDANNGWIGGYGGQIIHTSDGGLSWSSQTSNTDEHIYGISFIDANNGWAGGGEGVIMHTTDGGNTWTFQRDEPGTWLYDIYFTDANNGWAVGWMGKIIHTTDGGTTWNTQISGTQYNLNDVFFTDADNGWIVGWHGLILYTSDGGTTWNTQQSGTTADLTGVSFTDALHGFVAGEGGTILNTADGGNTWNLMDSKTTLNLDSIAATDTCHAWAAGEFGIILKYVTQSLPTYAAADYFNTTDGHGIRYNVIDDYNSLNTTAWAVSQYSENNNPVTLDFLFTLVQEGGTGGFFANSSMGGKTQYTTPDTGYVMFSYGYPSRNQGNFYMNFMLPELFSPGDSWSFGGRNYSVEYAGSQEVSGIEFADCIKVTVDDTSNSNDYAKGSGYFLLAPDIGIVRLFFNRTNGQDVFFEYMGHSQLDTHTFSGTVTYNGEPVKGICVQIANADMGTRCMTGQDGTFSIQAYGPDVVLMLGYDENQDSVFEFDIQDLPCEFVINNVSSDVSELEIEIPNVLDRTLYGDADGNGTINVLDMTKVARIILEMDEETPGADADGNGVVNVLDMTKIAMLILGREPVEPGYGGTITLAMTAAEPDFDLINWFSTAPQHLAHQALWEGDWTKGPAGGYGDNTVLWQDNTNIPDLNVGLVAESWEWVVNEGSNTVTTTLRIRDNIYFQTPDSEAGDLVNGRKLTVEDVAWCLQQHISNPDSANYQSYPECRDLAAEVTGPNEIQIVHPFSLHLDSIMRLMAYTLIFPPELWDAYGYDSCTNILNSVGTGPYYIDSYTPASVISLKRNKRYWETDPIGPRQGKQLPYVDSVKYVIMTDLSTRLAALRTGKLDMMSWISAEDANFLHLQAPDLLMAKRGSDQIPSAFFRMDQPPFNDIRVRKAMLYSLDLNTINDIFYQGEGDLISYPYFHTPAYERLYLGLDDPDTPATVQDLYSYNPGIAQQLLVDANYESGFTANLTLVQDWVDYYSVVRNYWTQIGITVNLDVVTDFGQLIGKNASLGFDGMIAQFISPVSTFPEQAMYTGDSWLNPSRVNDPYVNDMAAQIRATATTSFYGAMDMERELTKYLLEQVYAIPSPRYPNYCMWWPWLQNYSGEVNVGYMVSDNWIKHVWIDQDMRDTMGY